MYLYKRSFSGLMCIELLPEQLISFRYQRRYLVGSYKFCLPSKWYSLQRKMDEELIFITEDDGLDINMVRFLANQLVEPIPDPDYMGNASVEVTRNEDYFEVTVPQYTEEQFREHFRMSRATFQNLATVLEENIDKGAKIVLRKKLLFTIYVLSRGDSFLAAGDRFNFGKSTAHYIFKETIENLANLLPKYVKWPEAETYHHIANVFETRSRGFPGVVGVIDGCHIPMKQPPGNAIDFYNRHQSHSIILQGVCDHKMKFIDLYIGLPGRMHDANVFRHSALYNEIQTNNLIPDEYHLIGDSAYPLSKHLLTPFRDNGHRTNAEINYNIKLSSIRSTIERAFGLLKGKFRRLKYLDVGDLNLANKMVAAACVLHNFIIEHGEVIEVDSCDDNNLNVCEENNEEVHVLGDRNAVTKRNNIVILLEH